MVRHFTDPIDQRDRYRLQQEQGHRDHAGRHRSIGKTGIAMLRNQNHLTAILRQRSTCQNIVGMRKRMQIRPGLREQQADTKQANQSERLHGRHAKTTSDATMLHNNRSCSWRTEKAGGVRTFV